MIFNIIVKMHDYPSHYISCRYASLRKFIHTLIFIIFFALGYSQDITAYMDYRSYFYVFDKGVKKNIETLPVKNFKIGQTCIAYQNYTGNLKVYFKSKVYDMYDAAESYYVSKHFVLGLLNNQLKIFDNRIMMTLSTNVGTYAIADSLVAFQDNTTMRFNVYYKKQITQLEDLIVSNDIANFKVGGNVLAYIDSQDNFKLFYHGKVINLFSLNSSLPFQYEVGQDIIAYINNDDQSFNVYWMGQNYVIEDVAPQSFKTGNNYIAYVDNSGQFKLFSQGGVSVISETTPDFYYVTDNIIVYSEINCFKANYKSVSYLLEKYIPKDYLYDQGAIAYINNMGSLILFNDGKKETVTYDLIKNYKINGSLLNYATSNQTRIFYKGKVYD
jgi:hypothetical protein